MNGLISNKLQITSLQVNVNFRKPGRRGGGNSRKPGRGGELFHLETKFFEVPPKAKNSEKNFQFLANCI